MKDGPYPPDCNRDIYERGKTIAIIGTVGGSNRFERLIQAASRKAGVMMDWHFVGGRAVVKAFAEDVEKAKKVMNTEVYPVLFGGAPDGTFLVRDEMPCD